MDITKDFGSVDKFSRLYKIERIVFDFFLRIFYKKFIVKGLENLPADKPFIVAGNHQNALMDSLVLLKLLERPVFISRADLFKKKTLLTRFLVFCRIIPSYRMRDGKENLHLNNLVFRRVAEILKNGAPIVIFPEAQHFRQKTFASD
jgi:1-acyl-sn-glycerol-3-phosphate acyltransferase